MNEKTQQFYDDLEQRIIQAEEEAKATRERREKERKTRNLGRMLASLSNLYFTTRGAPSQEIGAMEPEESDSITQEQLARRRERLLKAHESIERLRMAEARNNAAVRYQENRQKNDDLRTEADIGYKANRQENENRKTNADIEKRQAEVEALNARGSLASAQAQVKSAEASIKQQEAQNLPVKQRQEAEVRRARAQQAWSAARRYQQNTSKPRKTLKDVRGRGGTKLIN